MLSLERAVEIGVDVLETDVRMTRDCELVLFHDDTLERTTGRSGRVADYTLQQLKEIDLGEMFTPDNGATYPYRGQGLSIVTLREAFEAFPDMRFNLDIKDTDPRAPRLVANIIEECGRESSVIVGSFHDRQVHSFRRLMPDVATAASPSEVTRFVFGLKIHLLRVLVRCYRYRAFQVPLKYGSIKVVNEAFVRASHERGVAVHVWTVNERPTMEQLIALGVDGIFTDRPALLREVLKDQGLL